MRGRRSGTAQAALGRKAGPMAHRLQPRGGARNEQEEYMAEYEESKDHGQCLHWSIGDEQGKEEHFISPFDPPSAIKCQCPGGCPGVLVFDGPNRSETKFFLACNVCFCGYEADSLYRDDPNGKPQL